MIENTRSDGKEIWLSDNDGSRGPGRLVLRVGECDSRLFYFRYSHEGTRKVVALGAYTKVPAPGRLTLQEARDVVGRFSSALGIATPKDLRSSLLARLQGGGLLAPIPIAPVVAPIVKEVKASKLTLLDLCDEYVQSLYKRGAQSARTVETIVKGHVKGTEWAPLPANSITPEQVTDLLKRLVDAGIETTARHLRQLLLAAYNLAMRSGRNAKVSARLRAFAITSNPVADTESFGKPPARKRLSLTKVELGEIWLELTDAKYDLSTAIRALRLNFYLGGQRCLQLLRCELSNVDVDEARLTLFDGKGNREVAREHTLPLTVGAMSEVRALRQIASDLGSPYLISGDIALQPLTASAVSKTMTKVSRKLLAEKKIRVPVCYANIRSVITKAMAELRIPSAIRDQIQSHGIVGVVYDHYDDFEYLEQKREALQSWEAYLIAAAEAASAKRAKFTPTSTATRRPAQDGKSA